MGVWPGRPLDVDVRASGNSCGERGVGAIAVADDVRRLVFGTVFEAKIGGCCGPADAFGWIGFVGVLVDEVAGIARDAVSMVMGRWNASAYFWPLATMLET